MAGIIIIFDAASTVLLAHLRITHRPKVFSFIKLTAIIINIGLNVWMVAGLRMGIEGILIANIAQSVVMFLLTIPFTLKMLLSPSAALSPSQCSASNSHDPFQPCCDRATSD